MNERQADALRRLKALCERIDEQTLRPGEKPLAQAIAETARAELNRMSCPHCPCTQTTECCYCDGTRTPLEDS